MAASSIRNRVGALNFNGQEVDAQVFGEKVGLFGKVFGCWHEKLSRPFSQEKIAYRSCLECGARKQFDSETLETHGAFYFPPLVRAVNLF